MYTDVDKYLIEWFVYARSKNLIINDAILQVKAKWFGDKLGIEGFKGSDKWVLNFKRRHGIWCLTLHGEAASVESMTVEDYRESFQELAKEYEPRNIFNLDETALFYKLTPNRTLCNQAKANGVKSSKERVSLVFCVSFTGEKLPPLVIGRAAMPQGLRGLDLNKIGVRYTNTPKSWMVIDLFQEYLHELNQKMAEEDRKILLLVDNAPSHVMDEELTNIKIKFLPKNTTSVFQPLDQGIIRSFKAHDKMALIQYLLTVGNNTPETMRGINIGTIVHWVSEAWKKVSAITITNYFKKTGLFGEEAELLLSDTSEGELQTQLTAVKATVSAEEYLDADNIDLIYDCDEEELTQKVYERISTFDSEKEDEDDSSEKPRGLLRGITREKTLAHIEELRTMMSLATTPTLRQFYQGIIFELMGSVERLSKQAKLDFGPAEQT